jgi:type I restriction enzyme M protein
LTCALEHMRSQVKTPKQEIWYYEHPYPAGYKSYSKTKPIRIEEFAAE